MEGHHKMMLKARAHSGGLDTLSKRSASATCATGGFYKSPTVGQVLNVSQPFTLSWDPSCLNITSADVFLFAAGNSTSQIHGWQDVPFAVGNYSDSFQPSWWGSATSANLQFIIVKSGDLSWQSTLPAGPVFSAKWDGTTLPASSDTGPVTIVGGASSTSTAAKGHHGAIAAAVIIPLLFLGAAIAGYFKWKQIKSQKKTQAFVNRRMSGINNDWSGVSAAGANAAVRSSHVGNRASVYSFGARPESGYGGQAGVGVNGLYTQNNADIGPDMSQRRPRLISASGAPRQSRISFADDPQGRPSGAYSRKSQTRSRAFHDGYMPDQGEQDAYPLKDDDIVKGIHAGRDSMAEVMPALNMMRTSGEDNEYMLPESPSKAHVAAPSHQYQYQYETEPEPVVQQAVHAATPDDMLRAYAARRAMAPAAPQPSYNGNGMRTLYSPEAAPEQFSQQQQHQQQYSYSNGGYSAGGHMAYEPEY